MAKLYWRVKINNKWTWRPADVASQDDSFVRVSKESMYEYIPLLDEEDDPSEDYCRAVEESE